MLRQRERFFKRMVGFLVLISVVMLLYIMQLYNRETKPFTERYPLSARLERADGLRVNTPVTLAGIPIGRVSQLEVGEKHAILVELELESRFQRHIRRDSVGTIQHPMLGNPTIDISIGTAESAVLEEGDVLMVRRVAELGDVVAELPERLERLDKILINIETITQSLAQKDGPLAEGMTNFNQAMDNMRQLTAELNQPDGTLHDGLKNFAEATAAAARVTTQVENSVQRLDKLLVTNEAGVAGVLTKTQAILSDIKVLSSQLAEMAPQIAELTETSRTVMHDADDVLRAAKGSILLRSNVPVYEEVLLDSVPRGGTP